MSPGTDDFPALRVDHVSVAVRALASALALLRRILPIRMRQEPRAGYDLVQFWQEPEFGGPRRR